MCKSPTAATRRLSDFSLIFPSYNICESEFCYVHRVVRNGEHTTATHFHPRCRQLELMVQPRDEFSQQPTRNLFSLGGIDEPEVQKMDQQNFPILLHRAQQPLPI